MPRTLVLAAILSSGAGCLDFDESHRVLISDSATNPNPWGVGPDAALSGSGSLVGDQLDLHLTATVDQWNDDLWESVLTGTIQVDLHGTIDFADPYILHAGDATLQAHLAMPGKLAGDHSVAIIQCYRPGN